MEEKRAGESLDALMAAFNTRIAELQELVIARNSEWNEKDLINSNFCNQCLYPATSIPELSAVDSLLTVMELQVQRIKDRVTEETEAIPKARKLIDASLKQQRKLHKMLSYLPERTSNLNFDTNKCASEASGFGSINLESEVTAVVKGKNGGAPPPPWYITADELDSLSSYMRGRLTIDKVNAAVNDMAAYAEANTNLINAPKKKLAENLWEKALELRDIAMKEAVRGKHFFLEADMKGPTLKHDHTGKAILTVLRHLRRISETRIGHDRVIILLRP